MPVRITQMLQALTLATWSQFNHITHTHSLKHTHAYSTTHTHCCMMLGCASHFSLPLLHTQSWAPACLRGGPCRLSGAQRRTGRREHHGMELLLMADLCSDLTCCWRTLFSFCAPFFSSLSILTFHLFLVSYCLPDMSQPELRPHLILSVTLEGIKHTHMHSNTVIHRQLYYTDHRHTTWILCFERADMWCK